MLDHLEASNLMRKTFVDRFTEYATNGMPPVYPNPLGLTKRRTAIAYIPKVKWENVELRNLEDNGEHWLHFTSRHVLKKQTTFAGGRNESVGTRFTTQGLIRIEIYFSKSSYETAAANILKMMTEQAFIQSNSLKSLWFRNSIIVDLAPEESHFRSNVLAEYQYDSVVK